MVETISVLLNINTDVYVRLTPAGIAIIEAEDESYRKMIPTIELHRRPEPDGRYRFMLWELMNLFGPSLYMGNMEPVFESNLIEVRSADGAIKKIVIDNR